MSASSSSTLPLTLDLQEIVQALQDANATRYLSAIGFVVLVYDHILTLPDEIKLIWRAPPSFPKYGFLFNRYLVLACLAGIAHEMCGFVGNIETDLCKQLLFATSMLSLCSIATGNILVLLRVVILWDHRPFVFKLMVGGFLASFITQTIMMVLTLLKYWPGIVWNSTASMCITEFKSPLLIGVWASPMLFEVLVLLSMILNALDRPQQAEMPLTRALYRDGITYFAAVTSFRTLNLTLSIVARWSLTMVGAFFVWGMITTILNRSLLRMRQIELDSQDDLSNPSGRTSPFGTRGVVIVDMDANPTERSPRWLELNKMTSEA